MAFIEVGALLPNGKQPKTKKELRENVGSVHFFSVSPFVLFNGGYADLPNDETKLTVVGPDMYRDRKWYATVDRNGKVT